MTTTNFAGTRIVKKSRLGVKTFNTSPEIWHAVKAEPGVEFQIGQPILQGFGAS